MPIYTKTGDKGKTRLANGQEISKSSPIIDFLGDLDELNSYIGICISQLMISMQVRKSIDFSIEIEVLKEIQKDLFIVGAISSGAKLTFNPELEVNNIEKTIDDYEKIIPKLTNFILPGGSISASHLHYARSRVRGLERKLVGLNSLSISPFIPYINRLSDLLFVMARYVNFKLKYKETIWKL